VKVWHVNLTGSCPRVDGITTAVARVAEAQNRAGADAAVFCPSLDDRSPARALRDLRRGLRNPAARPDVVHFHSLFRPFHSGVASLLRRHRVPYVVSPHSAAAPSGLARRRGLKRAYMVAVERRFLAGAAGVLCLTEVERADVARFAPGFGGPSIVVPNPVPDVDGLSWDPAPPPARPRVVSLSRFDVRQKGLDRLVAIAVRRPEVDFAVYGEPDKNEPELADGLRRAAPSNFHLCPPVFGPVKDRILRRAALFILPSRWEGLSMSLAEALAAGVPCAVSPEVASTLPIADEDLGLVLDDDPARSAEQLRSALEDRDQLETWSRAGAAFAARNFEATAVAHRTLDGYEAAIR
jgi:glycosyltransferase involved in cell wall biosynthesis